MTIERANHRQRKWQQKCKDNGCCVQCGKPNDDPEGRVLCRRCQIVHRDDNLRRYSYRLSRHMCGQCGTKLPEDDDHSLCPGCREKAREYQRRKKAKTQ